jgi:hypothetical protein
MDDAITPAWPRSTARPVGDTFGPHFGPVASHKALHRGFLTWGGIVFRADERFENEPIDAVARDRPALIAWLDERESRGF